MGGLGGALIDWVGGCPSRQTFWTDYGQFLKCISKHFWWAAAGLAGCLGPHVSIELIGGFVLAKGIGNVLLYGVESCRGVFLLSW